MIPKKGDWLSGQLVGLFPPLRMDGLRDCLYLSGLSSEPRPLLPNRMPLIILTLRDRGRKLRCFPAFLKDCQKDLTGQRYFPNFLFLPELVFVRSKETVKLIFFQYIQRESRS